MATGGSNNEETIDADDGVDRVDVEDVDVTDNDTMNVDDVDDDLIVVDVEETGHDDATMRAAAAAALAAAAAAAARPHQDTRLVSDPSAPSAEKAPHKGWQYSAEALGAALGSIPTGNETIEGVETAVKKVCAEHGTRLARFTSMRRQNGRLNMVGLKCVHGMRNRQGEYEGRPKGKYKGLRKNSSQRSGCKFQVTIRLPLRPLEHEHPRLTAMHLDHLHLVDKTVTGIRQQLEEPLSLPMEAVVAKLTGWC
ncbi:unnamed protein product [Laminaria digitata]